MVAWRACGYAMPSLPLEVDVTAALAQHSQSLADDLYQFLRDLDPARWRDDAEAAARLRLGDLRARIGAFIDEVDADPRNASFGAVAQRLDELRARIDHAFDDVEQAEPGRLRSAWNTFRLEVQPAYEQLAASLAPLDIHARSLRPTNYARSVYHALSGLFVVFLVEAVLPAGWLLPVAAAFTAMAWTMELSRRRWSWVNTLLMGLFKHFAHPHEAWRVNSSTWFTSALLVLSLTGRPVLISAALVVLALADPMAALVGRRFGTIPLVHGRSLQGTAAFVVTGAVGVLALLSLRYPALGLGPSLGLALGAGLGGGLAELFARRVDDNFAIPVSVAGVGMLVFWVADVL